MDNLVPYYHELSTNVLKYETLSDLGKQLLKVWPPPEECERKEEETTRNESIAGINSREITEVETLLTRAQTVYSSKSCHTQHGSSKTKFSETTTRSTSLEHTNGSFVKLGGNNVKKKSRAKVVATSQKDTGKTFKRHQITYAVQEKIATGKSLQTDRAQLEMPSKYHKLQAIIQRCDGACNSDKLAVNKAAATHFVNRIQPKKLQSNPDRNCILLGQACLLTKEIKLKLEALLSQDVKGLEEKTWQDILLIHTRLKHLTFRYLSIAKSVDRYYPDLQPQQWTGTTQATTLLSGSTRCSSVAKTSGSCDAKLPPKWNSFQEWHSSAQLISLVNHKQWELEFLKDLEHLVLPQVSQASRELELASDSIPQTIALIRALHLVFDLPSKPVYVNP